MRRLTAIVLSIWMLLGFAVAEENAAEALLDELTVWHETQAQAKDLQAWADGRLAETADGLGGWMLIALRQDGREFDASAARRKLEEETAGEEIRSVTKALRMSLTMLALGSESDFPVRTLERLENEQGLMPLIFGLHLMNNGVTTPLFQKEELVRRLLALQLEDGGWAVMGTSCDADCTAMALQALAPVLSADESAAAAAERGVEALSCIQLENGGFLGMDTENAESCAQVLLALSSLGTDARRDPRFVKAGGSVWDALFRFRLPDGGFAHRLSDGKNNDTAAVQAYYALVGYRRMLKGKGPYYVLDPAAAEETRAAPGRTGTQGLPFGLSGKGLACGIILLLGLLACGAAFLRKKRGWRTYAFIALLTAAATALVLFTEIRLPEDYYRMPAAGEKGIPTRISIRCDTVAGQNEYAPADGVILADTEILLEEGKNAFDQLLEATRRNRIQMEYDGTAAGVYVRGIGYLYEYDFGNLSGWMYRINGTMADVGASQYVLKEGDRIDWVYSTEIGRDLQENAD